MSVYCDANPHVRVCIMCTNALDNTLFDSLDRPLQATNNMTLWTDKCDYIDPISCSNLNKECYNLVCLQLNIRGVLSKQDDLHDLLQLLKGKGSTVDILLLCETFLNDQTKGYLNIQGYSSVNLTRSTKKCGGVTILYRTGLLVQECPQLNTMIEGVLESVTIEVKCKNTERLLISSMYRSPGSNEHLFLKEFDKKVKSLEEISSDLIIGIDQNLDLLKCDTHLNTQKFLSYVLEHEFLPAITRPTRITPSSATLIDNIYIKGKPQEDFESCILISDLSDHLPNLLLTKSSKYKEKGMHEFQTRKLDDAKIALVVGEICQVQWDQKLKGLTVNDDYDTFIMELNSILDKIAPIHTIKISKKKMLLNKWMTNGLRKSSDKCRKLYKETLKNGVNNDVVKKYREYRNTLTRLKRASKKQYYASKCKEHSTNLKKLWQIINQVTRKANNKTEIIDIIKVDNIEYSNPNKIANLFGSYFSTIGSKLAGKINRPDKTAKEYLSKIKRCKNTMYCSPKTEKDIAKIIDSLPNKNSSGIDSYSNKLVKKLKYGIVKPLTMIINSSLKLGQFPDLMKIAEVVPLLKTGSTQLLNNYRPVSLLVVMSKVLEKCIYSQVMSHLDKNKILYDSQYGFRAKRSCEQAILELSGNVLKANERGLHSAAVFLDLSKAFDTLDHELLLNKLEIYGIRGVELDWFRSYLSNRSLRVKLTNISSIDIIRSDDYKIDCGTAQGSCLGPLLFILFCNDIHLIPAICKIILFADDTTLYHHHRKSDTLQEDLRNDMILLVDWFKANKLSLNLNKTVGMKFWHSENEQFDLNIDGLSIPLVKSTKFLGVTIDNCLTWKKHATNVWNKINITKNLLTVSKNFLPINILSNVYYAHINSHIIYGIKVWGSMCPESTLDGIYKVQKYCIRQIYRLGNRTNTDKFFYDSKILPIKLIIKQQLCILGHQLSHEKIPSPIVELFEKRSHRYPTRNKHVPKSLRSDSSRYLRSFMSKATLEYRQLSLDLKHTNNTDTFTHKLKAVINRSIIGGT